MGEVVQQFVMQLVLNAIPVVVPLLIAMVVKVAVDAWATVKKTKPDIARELQNAAEFAVRAAEQVGLSGALKTLATSKLEYAIGVCESFLEKQGVKGVDLDLIRAAIEAEVIKSFPHKAE